jgi:hypothetical protein
VQREGGGHRRPAGPWTTAAAAGPDGGCRRSLLPLVRLRGLRVGGGGEEGDGFVKAGAAGDPDGGVERRWAVKGGAGPQVDVAGIGAELTACAMGASEGRTH